MEVRGLEDNAELSNGKFTFAKADSKAGILEKGKEYEYVNAGQGREEDF